MKNLLLFILALIVLQANAQLEKKEIVATRTFENINLDGEITEPIWTGAQEATNFSAFSPFNHIGSKQKTTVKILYDDQAIYLAATIYDPNPDSIVVEYTSRDDLGTSDFFGVYFDTYNDGLNAYGFFVNVAGIQSDSKVTANGNEDDDWDAVWASRTNLTKEGWTLEMKIPYSALRFPKAEKSTWGINFFRLQGRTRLKDCWNFTDRKKGPFITQFGLLTGIENISPPLRLAFLPYLAINTENKGLEPDPATNLKGGMDIKYGISENFTLDMMLIPDFGQVQSDKKSYNFSPYEQYFDEKRPYFTEGTEIFSKGNIFYSRRIGSILKKYKNTDNYMLQNEVLEEKPISSQLINSTKISGKTQNGLSIGVLNAITDKTNAIFRDTITNVKREITSQPITNYNLTVIDKALKNNSYLAFSNANVSTGPDSYFSNVSSSELRLTDNKSRYALTAIGTLSHIGDSGSNKKTGFRYYTQLAKISGNFKWGISQNVESDKYNPNDMGYLQRPNEITNSASVSYNIYEPFGNFLYAYNSLNFGYSSLFKPDKFEEIYLNFNHNSTFKNQLSMGMNLYASPVESHDYYESQTGKVFKTPPLGNANIWLSPDYRKTFIIDVSAGGWKIFSENRSGYFGSISPRWKVNNHLIIVYSYNYNKDKNEHRFYEKISADSVVFGISTNTYISQTLEADWILNNQHSFELEVYHNWTRAKYHRYGLLNPEGYIDAFPSSTGENLNYNAFSLDMLYRWEFSAGSELLVVLKNNIENQREKIYKRYSQNFGHMFSSDQVNRVSVKFLYYIDYQNLVKKKRRQV